MEKDINRMIKKLFSLSWILMVPLLALVVSCNDDEGSGPRGGSDESILEVAQSNNNLSIFVSAISGYPEITSSLDSESETYTVFAPTDNAFDVFLEAMGYNSVDDIPDDTLRKVVEYHIIEGTSLASTALTNGQSSQTLLVNESVTISLNGNTIMVNTSTVSSADIAASNGVIHIIDAVLVPAAIGGSGGNHIMSVVQAEEQLSTLADALSRHETIVSTLSGFGSYTLFAPTNEAFEDLLDLLGYNSIDEVPDDMLRDILDYHVTSQAAFETADFTNGQQVSTLLVDDSVILSVNGGSAAINSSAVVTADVRAYNGVVHMINTVLLPSTIREGFTTILDLADQNEELSLFAESIKRYPDLLSRIDGFSKEVTVFAPTNQGFKTLLNITSQNELDDIPDDILKRFLQYHIGDTSLTTAELADGLSINTLLLDERISVSADASAAKGFKIDKSDFIEADLDADNGVLHVITGFLFPSKEAGVVNTIMEPVYFNKEFNTLNAAIEKAGMFSFFVNRPANYTFFAPTNEGFESAGISSLDGLTSDSISTILRYHVHEDAAYTEAALQEEATLSTASGDISISAGSEGTMLNGVSRITEADITNNTGITHIIDQTLIPQN